MRWLAPVRAALQSLAAIWRRQDGFGRVLMAIGAANVTACLLLGLGLLVFSVMPWRGALANSRMALRVPTSAPTPVRPSPVPSPTASPTPSPTATAVPSATPKATSTPTVAPTRRPEARIEVTARMSDRTPKRNSRVTVYGRITKDGKGVKGVKGVPMNTTWQLANSTATCGGVSDGSGRASCTMRLGNISKGTEVQVRVAFSYQGQEYAATTSFRVR